MSLLYSLNFDASYNPGYNVNLDNCIEDGNIILNYRKFYGHQSLKIRCIISNIKYNNVKCIKGNLLEYGTFDIIFQDRLKQEYGYDYLPEVYKKNFCDLCKYEPFSHKFCKHKNLSNIPYKIFKGKYRSSWYGIVYPYLVYFPKGFLPWHFSDKYTTFVDLFDCAECHIQKWEFYNNSIFFAFTDKESAKKYIKGNHIIYKQNRQLEKKISAQSDQYTDRKEWEYREKNKTHINPMHWPRSWSYFSEIMSDHKVVHDIRVSNNYDLWI
jgi:hypothetical protein